MKLLTDSQHQLLIRNALARRHAAQNLSETDPWPVVKFYTPTSHYLWLITELDPAGSDYAFGLYYGTNGLPDLNFIKLGELEGPYGPFADQVVRDDDFSADKPISAYAAIAFLRGNIVT